MKLSDLRIEDQLILCCARSVVDADAADRIGRLSDGLADWPYFLDRASSHRVVPLAHCALARFGAETAPREVLDSLADHASAIARRNLLLTAELTRIVAWLDREGLQAIPYKGPTLAAMAYGNLALRQFGDLDFLVRPGDYQRAIDLFLAQGWRLAAEYDWECTVRDEERGLDVDLHHDVVPEQFPVRGLAEGTLTRLVPTTIAGRKVLAVSAEDMLLILAVQVVKDAWGSHVLRLEKITDIAELLRAVPSLDWDSVRARARAAGCLRMLSLAMGLTVEFLGAPRRDLRDTAPREDIAGMRLYVLSRLFDHPDHRMPLPMSRERFYFLSRERWRDRLFPNYLDFTKRLPPNERDFAVVALPERLSFLYYLIRPFRVTRDFIAQAFTALTSR